MNRFEKSDFILAAKGLSHDRIPVWFMRQAGRSLPEYFDVRGDGSILNAIEIPEKAAEITLQPTRRYDLDAAILFSDIMTPLWAIDFGVDIEPGVGPVTENPFRSEKDLQRFRTLTPDDIGFQSETIKILTSELDIPLIGFAGGPFTLATYIIEGKPSKNHETTKSLMFSDEKLWHSLCEKLTDLIIATLVSQIDSGVSAVQLFDSWAGILHPAHYQRYILPHSKRIFDALKSYDIPKFHFGINTGELLNLFADAGPDVVGVDWRTSISVARERTNNRVALQGNLDPVLCLGQWPAIESEARRILEDNAGNPGYIFNLGHGVLPETNPDNLAKLADFVHSWSVDANLGHNG